MPLWAAAEVNRLCSVYLVGSAYTVQYFLGKKVKVPAPNMQAEKENWVITLFILNLGPRLWWVGTPVAAPPAKKKGYPLCKRLCGPQRRSGRAWITENFLYPPGLELRTVYM
jgi:hypothetical protein